MNASAPHGGHAVARAGLFLEPLGEHHLPAMCNQLRDPQICWMAGLSDLSSQDEARSWICELAGESDRNFAVMSESGALVGVTGYSRSQTCALVQFWIGVDYQGQGLSFGALSLLLSQARADGVGDFFAFASRMNHRSKRTLTHAGFRFMRRLPKLLPPDDAMDFYCKLSETSRTNSVDLLKRLCSDLGEPLKLALVENRSAV